jgi:hypothetical protein
VSSPCHGIRAAGEDRSSIELPPALKTTLSCARNASTPFARARPVDPRSGAPSIAADDLGAAVREDRSRHALGTAPLELRTDRRVPESRPPSAPDDRPVDARTVADVEARRSDAPIPPTLASRRATRVCGQHGGEPPGPGAHGPPNGDTWQPPSAGTPTTPKALIVWLQPALNPSTCGPSPVYCRHAALKPSYPR